MVISRKKQFNYVLNIDYPIIGKKKTKMKYSFANAKPVNLRKIDYWFRVGQCGLHKGDFKPTLREIRGRADERKKSCKELSKAF